MFPFDSPELIPLKTPENQRISDVFRSVKRDDWGEKGYYIV